MISVLILESSPPIKFQYVKNIELSLSLYRILPFAMVVKFASKYILDHESHRVHRNRSLRESLQGRSSGTGLCPQEGTPPLTQIPLEFDCKDDSPDIICLLN